MNSLIRGVKEKLTFESAKAFPCISVYLLQLIWTFDAAVVDQRIASLPTCKTESF